MALQRDHYMVLGVPPIAGNDEIRKAYRTLTKKYHPDLNPEMKLYSDEKMKELIDAYNIVSDSAKRKEYGRQPLFSVKKKKKNPVTKDVRADAIMYTRKPSYEREPSLLERILSPFIDRKEKGSSAPVKVDYKQSDMHFSMGLSMCDNDAMLNQAREEFKMASMFDPAFSEALYNYALLSYKLGEFDEARIHFQKYLFLEKDDSYARKFISLLREDYQ